MKETSPVRAAIRARLRELAARPGGVCTADLPEFDRAIVARIAWREGAERKHLYRGGEGKHTRYFTDSAAAQRYDDQTANMRVDCAKRDVKTREAKQRKPADKRPGAAWREAEVSVRHYTKAPWDKDTPAIRPAGLKVQVCPSPAHFGPAAKIHGVGA